MTLVRELLDASPARTELPPDLVAGAIDACVVTAQACTSCADSCLAEEDVAELRRCIALCQTCVELCTTTLRLLSRPFASDHLVTHRALQACLRACSMSAEECRRHAAHHRHCALCEPACRACIGACTQLLEAEAFKELEKLAGA